MVAWLAAGLEGLDDEHAAATAGARLGEWLRRRRIDFDRLFGRRLWPRANAPVGARTQQSNIELCQPCLLRDGPRACEAAMSTPAMSDGAAPASPMRLIGGPPSPTVAPNAAAMGGTLRASDGNTKIVLRESQWQRAIIP